MVTTDSTEYRVQNCSQQNTKVTRLQKQCQMLLVDSETAGDKRFLESASRRTGLRL